VYTIMFIHCFKVFNAAAITTTNIYWKLNNYSQPKCFFCVHTVNASQWDYNWDDRRSKYQTPSEFTRKLLFVDNLQCENNDKKRNNIALRIEELVKKRNYKIVQLTSSVRSSNCEIVRADIQRLVDDINDRDVDLPDKIEWSSFYNENVETAISQPKTPINHGNCGSENTPKSQANIFKNSSHLEVVFRDIFYRILKPLACQRVSQDGYENKKIELYCGDAEIHKWLVCRALQLPLEAYGRFDSGGFTEFTIYEDGTILCDSINENSHLDIGNDKIQLKEEKKRKLHKSSTSSNELSCSPFYDGSDVKNTSDGSNVLCFNDDNSVVEECKNSKSNIKKTIKKSRQAWKRHKLEVIDEEGNTDF